jgi:predicted GNAT family acetyltransferase
MFLLGNLRAAGLVDNGQRYAGVYTAAFEGEAITGVAGHFWNERLVLQAPEHLDTLWLAAVQASGRRILGLAGPASQVARVLDFLAPDPANLQVDEVELLYVLPLDRLAVPAALATGALHGRPIAMHDLDQAVDWWVGYGMETLGEEDTTSVREQRRLYAESAIGEARTWVLEEAGRLVAMSSFNARIREAVQIGGVYTPPALRGQGYARAVVAASLLAARSQGAHLATLFTGVQNLAAQRAYEALGFQVVGDYRLVTFRTPLSAPPK